MHSTPQPFTGDLFDQMSPASARREFDAAFLAWRQSIEDSSKSRRPLDQPLSQAAYLNLWNVFARWCTMAQTPALRLDDVSAADLARFLQEREELLLSKAHRKSVLKSGHQPNRTANEPQRRKSPPPAGLTNRYVWRVLHVIDRVLVHRAETSGQRPNPAARELLFSRPEWQHANARHRDALPDHLPPAEASVLVNYLSRWRTERSGAAGGGGRWQDLRNLAAIALHLGGGLTPAEVRAVEVTHVVTEGGRQQGVPWKLRVPALGETASRETPLSPWAGRVLAAWLEARGKIGEGCGSMLFPATRTGRPWSKLGHYKAITETLEKSGISKEYVPGGAFRLRHTFAIRQLRRNQPPEQVAKWLGVKDPDVVARYLAVVDNSEVPV